MKRWKVNIEIEKVDDGYIITQSTRHAGEVIPEDLKGEVYRVHKATPAEAKEHMDTELINLVNQLNEA